MTKKDVLYEILKFGKDEQKTLTAQGKLCEAYQFEHARVTLLYALTETIKEVKERLYYMTNYHEERLLLYVNDDYVRLQLVELRKKLFKE